MLYGIDANRRAEVLGTRSFSPIKLPTAFVKDSSILLYHRYLVEKYLGESRGVVSSASLRVNPG